MGRETSFGEMRETTFAGRDVEMMTFETEGRDHAHDSFEVAFCLQGIGHVEVHGERQSYTEGDIVVVPPDTPHRMIPLGSEKYKWLITYYDLPPNLWMTDQVAEEVEEMRAELDDHA